MADFKTHVGVAAGVSGMVASAALAVGVISPFYAIALWAAGVLGGLLPDIDSDSSQAVHWVFTLIASLLAVLAMMGQLSHWPVVYCWLLGLVVFVLVRFPLLAAFKRFTVHRGVFHSLLANSFFAVLATFLCSHFLHFSPAHAWAIGSFVFLGAMIHLLLDELYSVDLAGGRMKKSFGTALKLTDFDYPWRSAFLLAGTLALFWASPALSPFTSLVAKGSERCVAQCLHGASPWAQMAFDVHLWWHQLLRFFGV